MDDLLYEDVIFNIWLEWDNLLTTSELEELADYHINIEKDGT